MDDGPIRCRCGREAILHVDMSNGPGCMCHIACDCGISSDKVWDVRLPVADLDEAWATAQRRADPMPDYINITRDIVRH